MIFTTEKRPLSPGAGVGGGEEPGDLEKKRDSTGVAVSPQGQSRSRPSGIVVRHQGDGGSGLTVALSPGQQAGHCDQALVLHTRISVI